MSSYLYHCKKCGKTFEKAMTVKGHAEHPRPACPACKSHDVEQIPSAFQTVTASKA